MATSGSVDFTLDARQVIGLAFGKIGVKAAEQALQASEMQDGVDALNLMLKAWQAQGIHLWTKEEGVIFLDVGKTDYLLGATGDEATTLDDFVNATTSADEIAAAVVIDVTDTTGMVAAANVGVQLDAGVRHWTTIVSVDSPTQITITDGLPSAASSGSTVYTFTNLIQRPLRVLSTRRQTVGQDNEITVNMWSRSEYFNQVNKLSQGTVVNAYYSPQLGNGRFYVWQTANSVNDIVRITFERPIEDIDIGDDNLDFPVEWTEAIVYNLAARLADDYDAPAIKVQTVNAKADRFLDDLLGFDEEMESLNLQPDFN